VSEARVACDLSTTCAGRSGSRQTRKNGGRVASGDYYSVRGFRRQCSTNGAGSERSGVEVVAPAWSEDRWQRIATRFVRPRDRRGTGGFECCRACRGGGVRVGVVMTLQPGPAPIWRGGSAEKDPEATTLGRTGGAAKRHVSLRDARLLISRKQVYSWRKKDDVHDLHTTNWFWQPGAERFLAVPGWTLPERDRSSGLQAMVKCGPPFAKTCGGGGHRASAARPSQHTCGNVAPDSMICEQALGSP